MKAIRCACCLFAALMLVTLNGLAAEEEGDTYISHFIVNESAHKMFEADYDESEPFRPPYQWTGRNHSDDFFVRSAWRNGEFKNYNTLDFYYRGYGGMRTELHYTFPRVPRRILCYGKEYTDTATF